jgi:hypothetical protein
VFNKSNYQSKPPLKLLIYVTISYVRRKCKGRLTNTVLMHSVSDSVVETDSQLKFDTSIIQF